MSKEIKSESFIAVAIKFWLPWVLTVIASAIAISQFVSSTSDYRLSYDFYAGTSLPTASPEYELKIVANDQEIAINRGMKIQTITFWNSGRKSIGLNDLRAPMSIEFRGCSALAVKLVGRNNIGIEDAEVEYIPNQKSTKQILIRAKNFDPGEALKFAFIGNCTERNLRFVVLSPIISGAIIHSRWMLYTLSWSWLGLVIVVGLLGFAGIGRLWRRHISFKPIWLYKILFFVVTLIPLGFLLAITPLVLRAFISSFLGVPLLDMGPV